MKYVYSKLASWMFCAVVLASSSASAQFGSLPLHLDVSTTAELVVTRYGVSTHCTARETQSGTNRFYLAAEVGAFDEGARAFRCGDFDIQIYQSVQVTAVYAGRSYVSPAALKVYTSANVVYPDGDTAPVLEDTFETSISTARSWRTGASHRPQNVPGVVFYAFADTMVGELGD